MKLIKAWFLSYFSGLVFLSPYQNLYFEYVGLRDTQIGLLALLRTWTTAPASFFWSGLADRYQAHRRIMLLLCLSSTLLRSSMGLTSSFSLLVALVLASQFFTGPITVLADTATMAVCRDDGEYGKHRLWGAIGWGGVSTLAGWLITTHGIYVAFVAFFIVSLPAVVLAWHMPFQQLYDSHKQQRKQQQEEQGIELSAASVEEEQQGLLQQAAEPQQQGGGAAVKQHAAHHVQVVVEEERQQGFIVQQRHELAPASELRALGEHEAASEDQHSPRDQQQGERGKQHGAKPPGGQHSKAGGGGATGQQREEAQQQTGPVEFWSGLRQLLGTPAVLVFMWQAVVMGFGVGIIGEYLFLYLQELGGTGTLMGLSLTVTCAAEIPAFHFQGKLLGITGVSGMLHVVLGTFVLRLTCYYLLPLWGSPWAVLPVELLHGVTFACGWGAGTINCKRVAPQGLEATMQGIFQGLYFGVGQGLGGIIGGALKERYGSQNLYGLAACCVLGGWATVVVAEHACRWHEVAAEGASSRYQRVVEGRVG